MQAPRLPKSLREAATYLRNDESLRAAFGATFTDYYAHIKEAEFARFAKDGNAETSDVTPWEQNDYLDLF
jgi:glutamine synthetase